MGLTAAICTQCGANIEVDSAKDAGVCNHCGTAFITEKVINNYHIYNITNNPEYQKISAAKRKINIIRFIIALAMPILIFLLLALPFLNYTFIDPGTLTLRKVTDIGYIFIGEFGDGGVVVLITVIIAAVTPVLLGYLMLNKKFGLSNFPSKQLAFIIGLDLTALIAYMIVGLIQPEMATLHPAVYIGVSMGVVFFTVYLLMPFVVRQNKQ